MSQVLFRYSRHSQLFLSCILAKYLKQKCYSYYFSCMNFPYKYHIFSSISLYPVMAIIEYWSTKLPPSPNNNIHNTISLFHTHTIYMVSSAYLQNDTTVTLRLRLNFYAHFGCSSSRTNVLPYYTFLVSTTGGSGAGLRFISSGFPSSTLEAGPKLVVHPL